MARGGQAPEQGDIFESDAAIAQVLQTLNAVAQQQAPQAQPQPAPAPLSNHPGYSYNEPMVPLGQSQPQPVLNTVQSIMAPRAKPATFQSETLPMLGSGFFALTGNSAMSNYFGQIAERNRDTRTQRELIEASSGVMDRIREGDMQGASQALEQALQGSDKLSGSVLAPLLRLREQLAARQGEGKNLSRALAGIDFQNERPENITRKMLDAGVTPDRALQWLPQLHQKDKFEFQFNEANGVMIRKDKTRGTFDILETGLEKDTPPSPEMSGRWDSMPNKPVELEGKSFRDVLRIARGKTQADPETKAQAQRLGGQILAGGKQISELDSAVNEFSKGKYRDAEAAANAGPEGTQALAGARKMLEDAKLKNSERQGLLAAQVKEQMEMARPFRFRKGYEDTLVMDPKTLNPLNSSVMNENMVRANPDAFAMITSPDGIKKANEARIMVSQLGMFTTMAEGLIQSQPGIGTLGQAVKIGLKGVMGFENERAFNDFHEALKLRIGAVFNQGRPTEADAKAAGAILPSKTDSIQSARAKSVLIKALFEDDIRAQAGLLSFDDVKQRAIERIAAAGLGKTTEIVPGVTIKRKEKK